MNIFKLISAIFGPKKASFTINFAPKKSKEQEELDQAFADLEDQKNEELRIPELENAIMDSFNAVGYELTYMPNKVANIAGHLSYEQQLNQTQTIDLFKTGINICDCAMPNPIKLVKAAEYFYNNYYSPENQLEYFNHTQRVSEKYELLFNELNEK